MTGNSCDKTNDFIDCDVAIVIFINILKEIFTLIVVLGHNWT